MKIVCERVLFVKNMCIALLHVNEWFWSQCYNQVIGLELQACWRKMIVLIEIYIWQYKIILQRLWKRIPLVMDDNEEDFKNVEHLFEWLCCCKWIHFSLNWRNFWITHLLANLLFWGAVTTPQTSKIRSFPKILFANRSLLLQSAPS